MATREPIKQVNCSVCGTVYIGIEDSPRTICFDCRLRMLRQTKLPMRQQTGYMAFSPCPTCSPSAKGYRVMMHHDRLDEMQFEIDIILNAKLEEGLIRQIMGGTYTFFNVITGKTDIIEHQCKNIVGDADAKGIQATGYFDKRLDADIDAVDKENDRLQNDLRKGEKLTRIKRPRKTFERPEVYHTPDELSNQ